MTVYTHYYNKFDMDSDTTNENYEKFYSKAVNYWSEIPPTIDGMLGGLGFLSQIDIKDSKLLLKQLFQSNSLSSPPPGRQYALDCGAGIGRITKHLLIDQFENVDLVEQNPKFLEQAKQYLGPQLCHKIGNFYSIGLQVFQPCKNKYDVIWIQWVLGHLTDTDLVQFLKNCKSGLKSNGVIIIKENVSSTEEIDIDEQDSSVTRPISLFRKLFAEAELDCYRQVKQRNFPKGLYPVYMYVFKPSIENIYHDDNDKNSLDIYDTQKNTI